MQAGQPLDNPPDAYITALLVPKGGAIVIDTASLEAIGIRCKPQSCCYCHSAPMIAWPTPAVHVLPGWEAPDADPLEMPLLNPQSQQLQCLGWELVDQSGGLKPPSLQGDCGGAFNAG